MEQVIKAIILLALGAYCWFGMAQNASEESATGCVKVWKGIFGLKGYVITAKVLAVFCTLAALAEMSKLVMG